MKLHTYESAPSPRRVHLFLAYKGIELPTRTVDLREHEQWGEDFLRLNPRGTVPVLELDDGSALSDGIAICTYLEHLYPERPLMGTGPEQQARVLSWHMRIYMDGFLSCANALRNSHPAFAGHADMGPRPCEQIPALAERGKQRLHQFLHDMDHELANRDFLLGDTFSMADIDLLVALDFSRRLHLEPETDISHLNAWRLRTAHRLDID
ncbi:glutathione S-transferase family protein [Oleiagrimonas sp.]|jgi:glutathione S-transferase|uniref:glutathione S-transferase family protein n=1 Tax=Oleiagrimonas sp. TaxID=2010330 RepID=UPI0026387492|nr:glutathione S-transferase family protein [Oleiagrimonas sp.]MDA3912975.1 glutathione S-transferase family protein [Oleiagrimonas sp.]